jgi:glycosyltransferase involved in cell wall biosynthesis
MKLACTGFVSTTAGSVSAANALLLKELLIRGWEIDFFSKPTFVDPRPIVGGIPGFRFIAVTNAGFDSIRRKLERLPLVGAAAGLADSYSYNRLLVRQIRREHEERKYDLCLWLGDYARGAVSGLPTVSFPQGPPGTDARSILARLSEIRALVGPVKALKWELLARLRLSKLGIPPLQWSDHFIIGSRQSSSTLQTLYSIAPDQISVLPYPIDLKLFRPKASSAKRGSDPINEPKTSCAAADLNLSSPDGPILNSLNGPLRILWLGRIVPRKRLDVFLDGALRAINQGIDLKITMVGSSGFVSGYEAVIRSFPFQDRLEHRAWIDRSEVPALLNGHDVLAQPSDEENFGSSVAEAQACGLPVIVGRTNGNADYLSSRDIHLADESPETFANALVEMSRRKISRNWGDVSMSRRAAKINFRVDHVTDQLVQILETVCGRIG